MVISEILIINQSYDLQVDQRNCEIPIAVAACDWRSRPTSTSHEALTRTRGQWSDL